MPVAETRFAVLLFTDIVGSTELKARYGVPAYTAALQTHNGHFERIARECPGIRILQNMGDGYFAEAGGVAEAVTFALLFQHAMREGPWSEVTITTRVGIHAGEVATLGTDGGSGLVAPAADLAARVMSLAVGGQILLSRSPFDEARHFVRVHPPVGGGEPPALRWLAHGSYVMKGCDDPMEIFEVGAEGFAPLIPPPNSEKARRAIQVVKDEKVVIRPAPGLEVPERSNTRSRGKLYAALVVVLLVLITVGVLAMKGDLRLLNRGQQLQTQQQEQMLLILRSLPQILAQEKVHGSAFEMLEKQNSLPAGALDRELTRFADELLARSDTSSLDRGNALFLKKDFRAAEDAALAARSEALAAPDAPLQDSIEALRLAGWSAQQQAEHARALEYFRAAAALTSKERDSSEWASVQRDIASALGVDGEAGDARPSNRDASEGAPRVIVPAIVRPDDVPLKNPGDLVMPIRPPAATPHYYTGGTISDSLSFALEAAEPHVKAGFTVREDYWGGDLAVKSTKAIVHQLFKGNEYWFWMGTDVKSAKISVHIYDSEGNLAEVEAWTKPHMAGARVVPKKTGSYYLIVEVEKSPEERTTWSLAYGFR